MNSCFTPVRLFVYAFLSLWLWQTPPIYAQSPTARTRMVVAFGSCNKQYLPQPLWDEIIKNKPALWVWLGDNIYSDTEDMALMKTNYDSALANPGYQRLIKNTKVIGMWDDHDYGVNDGGKEYPKKEESKKMMFDFLGYPQSAPVRQRKGAYHSYTLSKNGRTIKVILLDTRYFRSPLKKLKGACVPSKRGTILGKAQWKWLKKELATSQADVNIIGSGIQIIPDEHRFEKWANFPKERRRLLGLIAKSKAKNTLLISGDRHIAEVSKHAYKNSAKPIYEITSSGLTHTWSKKRPYANQYREGELIIALNFGLLEFDWGSQPKLIVKIKGKANQTLLEKTIPLQK